ncbi:MAG: VOC family protein [Proteobacteria bacterium]|nr:VOC family protein [Pseudomonadota bacterium]
MFALYRLYTRDLEQAYAFYQGVFGWKIHENGLCASNGHIVAAIAKSKAPPQVPSFWLPLLGVDDVDSFVEQATLLGAKVRQHVPGIEAVIVDPRGTSVGVCKKRDRFDKVAWNELLTDDAEVAVRFYASLNGLTTGSFDLGPLGTYHLLRRGGEDLAGVMKHPDGLHPHWQLYFGADDVDAMTQKAIDLGANLFFAPKDQPGFGRWSAIDDPTGAGLCFLDRTKG